MARTRFDEHKSVTIGAATAQMKDGGAAQEEVEALNAAQFRTQNPFTIRYIDPSVEPREAIRKLELPAKTMYLIDKVVRAKALQGPIGIDNSEVINLERERDLKKRDQYVANLAERKGTGATSQDQNSEDEDENNDEFLDDDEQGLDARERENLANEKLLKRLYVAAQNDIDGAHFEGEDPEEDERRRVKF